MSSSHVTESCDEEAEAEAEGERAPNASSSAGNIMKASDDGGNERREVGRRKGGEDQEQETKEVDVGVGEAAGRDGCFRPVPDPCQRRI